MATSAHAHPSLSCSIGNCENPVVARVTVPNLEPGRRPTVALIRSAAAGKSEGKPMCLDHAHYAVDLMLLRATDPPEVAAP